MSESKQSNYDSGPDYVLEYGDLRFSFNEKDFAQRVEAAAVDLGFIEPGLDEEDLHDLVLLVVNGVVSEPASSLGEHINSCWPELVGPSDRSLVHWLRRLVFRTAWLDHKVKEGDLDVEFKEDTSNFSYVDKQSKVDLLEVQPRPSWARVAYRS